MNEYYKGIVGRPKHALYKEILDLRREGHTYDAIAYLLDIHRSTIATICQREGLKGKIKCDYLKNQSH